MNEQIAEKLDPRRFSAMSGKLAALLAYIIQTDRWTTNPVIAEACIDSSGNVMVRHEGGIGMEWFGGTASELMSNLNRLMKVAGLDQRERAAFNRLRRKAITDWRQVEERAS